MLTENSAVTNLIEIIRNLADAGGLALLIAFVAEWIPAYQKLASQTKFFLMLGLCLGLPVVARILIDVVPGGFWEMLEPYWQSLARGALVFGGTQLAHNWRKRKLEASIKASSSISKTD